MSSAGFEANNHHIARFEAKPYPKPQPATAVTQAFEAYAYGKIVVELRSDDAVIKAKAVVAARQLLVAPQKHIQCIAAGITPALIFLLQAPDESLQAEAATTLQLVMAKEVGCRDTLQHGGLPQLLQLLKQPSPAVKDAAYGALGVAAKFETFRSALMHQQGALAALVGHIQQEEPARAAQALELLLHCTQVRHNQDALSQLIHIVHAVPKLAAIVSSSSSAEPVRLGATKLLAALTSTQEEARTQAVDAGCIPVLLGLLTSGSAELACAAAAALMMSTLAKEAKVALHEVHGVSVLFNVLRSQQPQQQQQLKPGSTEEQFLINVLQTVSNVAEYPPCRSQLQEARAGELLQGVQQQEGRVSDMVCKAAAQALRMVGFHN